MKNKLAAVKQKLKSPVVTHLAASSLGAIAGSAVIFLYYRKLQGEGRMLNLSGGAYEALINDETNFVRFWSDKNDHIFYVTLNLKQP